MASVVGGGDFPRFHPRLIPPFFARPSTKLDVGDEDRRRRAPAHTPLSSPGVPFSLFLRSHPQIRSSPALWSSACYPSVCSFPVTTILLCSDPRSGDVESNGLLAASRKFKRRVGWVFWYGREVGVMLKTIGGVLIPVVYCIVGVGPNFVSMSVLWSAGVCFGWCFLYISTGVGSDLWFFSTGVGSGLLLDYSQCLVACFDVPHGRSLGWCLSSTPRGVFLFVPSGACKPLTLLVSTQDNYRWAPYHDGLNLGVYIITVSVVVFLTLATFHHIV